MPPAGSGGYSAFPVGDSSHSLCFSPAVGVLTVSVDCHPNTRVQRRLSTLPFPHCGEADFSQPCLPPHREGPIHWLQAPGRALLSSAKTLVPHFSESSPGLFVGNQASLNASNTAIEFQLQCSFRFNAWSYMLGRKMVRTDSSMGPKASVHR